MERFIFTQCFQAIKGFWIENQNAIKKSMVEKIQWNPTLENFNWRVCLKSGLPSNQLNTPVLDMELHIKDPMCNVSSFIPI